MQHLGDNPKNTTSVLLVVFLLEDNLPKGINE